MRSSIKRTALAIGMAGAMSVAFAAPSSALPMSSSASVLKSAAASDDVTQVRYRGGRGFRGAGIATGVGLGLLGVGLATGGYGGYGWSGGYGGYGHPGYASYGYAPAYYGGGYGGYGYPSYGGYGGYGYGPSVSIGFGPSYGYGGGYYGGPYAYGGRRYVHRAYRGGRSYRAGNRRYNYALGGLNPNQRNRAIQDRRTQY